jgi:hypothetical protein
LAELDRCRPVAVINSGPKNGREVVIGLAVHGFLCLASGCDKVAFTK